ncbi:MAG TPA: DsrE family protein [Robiginitalea sp.]|nr:DsrE family protein [Robiginitalea sp.]
MKKMILMALALFGVLGLHAQEKPIKLVLDVSSENPEVHQTAARHLRLMSEAYPDSQFEMVIYSAAYKMVDKNASAARETLEQVVKLPNVSVVVCEQSIKRHNLTMDDLIPGVTTVPDGIYEIVMRQQQGWGYVKEVR